MHLGLRLPNVWYRARMRWHEGGAAHSTIGVTLPGTPALITGSNGQAAWGFTNSYGDWVDLVVLEMDSAGRYQTPDGWERLDRIDELIDVAGAEPDTLRIEHSRWGPVWTSDLRIEHSRWGPVWTSDVRGRPLALRWTAHDTEGVNLTLLELELTSNVEDLVAIAGSLGMPQQNLVCADSEGSIAWTIAGRIPRREGWDGRLPVSWIDGSHGWRGYLEADEQPAIIEPEEGRLWTANNRVTANDDLALIGQGGYALGARARQIRDGLRALDQPVESDMLALQLDDRALFLEEWRELALTTLASDHGGDVNRAEFERLITEGWDGHASTGSAGFRLVRAFNIELVNAVYAFLTADCLEADPDFNFRWLLYRHAVVWELVNQKPMNLLPADHQSWDSVILASIDRAMESATRDGRPASGYVWGDLNTTRIAHPFTLFAPQLSRWLMAPAKALPGASFLPRVQHPTSGASERLIVSPGREESGIFHMPGGQSGHPLSPFFLAGHDAWEEGRATPLLPGEIAYRLELVP
jgi:penicillin amidase